MDINDATTHNDDADHPAGRPAGHQPALTGCPWHDVNEMLQAAGLRPTRQRMALGWLLKDKRITSVLIGASSVTQLADNLACLENLAFSSGELNEIEAILKNG